MPVVAAPALIAVAAALLALLLLYGVKFFVQAVAGIIPKGLPVLGDFLHNAVLAAGAAVMAAIQWIMADVIRPVINFVLAPVFAILNWLAGLETAVRLVVDEVVWLVASGIPQLAHDLRVRISELADALRARISALRDFVVSHVAHVVALAVAALGSRIHDLRSWAVGAIAATEVALGARIHDLRTWAVGAIAATEAALGARIHDLRTWTAAQIDSVAGLIKSELSVAEGYTDTAVSDAIKAMTHSMSVAVAGVIQTVDVDTVLPLAAAWPGVLDDISGLEGVIGLDLPDIGAAIRAIPRAIPTDLTGAMAIVGAISIPMLRYMRDCGVPNCRNLSSLGRDLSELLSALEGGFLIGLLAALCTDPVGTAHFLDDYAAPIAEDAIGAAKSLLGV